MDKENKGKSFESKEIEQWFDSFFLDSYTNYLDETVFRIDLYDSNQAIIVEALLPGIKKENIEINITKQELQIKVKEVNPSPPNLYQIKSRTVQFPFKIENLKSEASFLHDVLEIRIFKEK